jgi:hypothetical protein
MLQLATFPATPDTNNPIAGLLHNRVTPDVMIIIMQQLPNFATLHNLLAAVPTLEPLHASYRQSIDMAVTRNEVGHPLLWSAVCTLVATQSPYRQPPEVPSESPATLTALEPGPFEEIVQRMDSWRGYTHRVQEFIIPDSLSIDLEVCRLRTLLWACVPEAKHWNAKARHMSAGPGEFHPLVIHRVIRLILSDARLKTPEYMCRYSKVEKFFEVYRGGGKQEKWQLRKLYQIASYWPMPMTPIPGLFAAMQVSRNSPNDVELRLVLVKVVLGHITAAADFLNVELY